MGASDVIENAFAMQFTIPSFPRGPYRYANREHLIVTYRTDRAALELVALGDGAGLRSVICRAQPPILSRSHIVHRPR